MLKLTSYLQLDEDLNLLVDLQTGTETPLTFSEAAVLAALLQQCDKVLGKEVLLAAGWPDRVVAPTSLTQCVSTLRKKLQPYDDIQLNTLARQGYQLQINEPQNEVEVASTASSPQTDASEEAPSSKRLPILLACIVLLVLLAIAAGYYWLNSAYRWQHETSIPLNIGGQKGQAQLIYRLGTDRPAPWRWQKHIAPESNHIAGFGNFSAYAMADNGIYSLALCPGGDYRNCSGKGLMNIVAVDDKPAGLDMTKFLPLMQAMENRVSYNKIIIPEGMCKKSDVNEHNYQADVYFPVAGKLLERYDINMSLVYDTDKSGSFYFSSCLTDQDCLTAPIKYTFRGDFTQDKTKIGDWQVDAFHIQVKCKNLYNPEMINPSAAYFFRNIRKDDIQDDQLTFYRLYQNEASAIWIIPRMGNIVVWTKYQKVGL